MRVLLIEDEAAVARGIELILKSEGFNVYSTDLGEEGVNIGKVYEQDIILLDINLPYMSGLDVYRIICAVRAEKHIMIITICVAIKQMVQISLVALVHE